MDQHTFTNEFTVDFKKDFVKDKLNEILQLKLLYYMIIMSY